MSWRNRQRLWPRRAWRRCLPRHSLPAVVGRVRVAAATGHVFRRCALAFGDHASDGGVQTPESAPRLAFQILSARFTSAVE